MKVKVKCPASCGELIQGIIGDREKLISLPIDIYSEIVLTEGKSYFFSLEKRKAYKALVNTFKYFRIPSNYIQNISLEIKSNIPIAKGMASSTADICGTIMAVAKIVGKKLSNKELAKLCCDIEPTDSIIFDKLTLFDHINGDYIREFEWNPEISILVLEGKGILNTEDFRKTDYNDIRNKNKEITQSAYNYFLKACRKKDKKLLGLAATLSSFANQNIIYKPKLEEIVEISTKLNAYGVNVAHSGTILGILYDDNITDKDLLIYLLKQKCIHTTYPKIYSVKTVKGGVRYL